MSIASLGIIDFGFVTTFPNQALTVACTVTSDTITPTADQVTLEDIGDRGISIGAKIQEARQGMFLRVVFSVAPPVPEGLLCLFTFEEGSVRKMTEASIFYGK